MVVDQHEFGTIKECSCSKSTKHKEFSNFYDGVADTQRQRSIGCPSQGPQTQRQEAEVAKDESLVLQVSQHLKGDLGHITSIHNSS